MTTPIGTNKTLAYMEGWSTIDDLVWTLGQSIATATYQDGNKSQWKMTMWRPESGYAGMAETYDDMGNPVLNNYGLSVQSVILQLNPDDNTLSNPVYLEISGPVVSGSVSTYSGSSCVPESSDLTTDGRYIQFNYGTNFVTTDVPTPENAPSGTWMTGAWDTQQSPTSRMYFAGDQQSAENPNGDTSTLGTLTRNGTQKVKYHISMTNNKIAIVLEGDNTLDQPSSFYSFMYFGTFIPIESSDNQTNVALTCGAYFSSEATGYQQTDLTALLSPYLQSCGTYVADGMQQFSVLESYTGLSYHSYYPSFLAFNETPVDNETSTLPPTYSPLQASAWTGKYHFSEIYLVEPYEGYRGKLEDVVIIPPWGVKRGDTFVDSCATDINGDSVTKTYKYFDINIPNSFLTTFSPDSQSRLGIRIS